MSWFTSTRGRETLKIAWTFEPSKPTPIDTSSNRSHLVTNSSTNYEPGIQIYEPMRAILLETTTACTPALGNRDSWSQMLPAQAVQPKLPPSASVKKPCLEKDSEALIEERQIPHTQLLASTVMQLTYSPYPHPTLSLSQVYLAKSAIRLHFIDYFLLYFIILTYYNFFVPAFRSKNKYCQMLSFS